MSPAIFLDRDGTLNEEMGYINHPDRFRIFPFVAESLRIFNEMGFKVFVVTNQSGVARGYFTEDLVKQLHDILIHEMERNNAHIDAIYYCPHHPDGDSEPYRKNCTCRKPKAGLIEKAMMNFQIDLKLSYGIGDRYKDVLFAKKMGMQSGMVLTGYGKGEYEFQRHQWQISPDIIGQNLLELAEKIRDRG